jgi:hypothetical protein
MSKKKKKIPRIDWLNHSLEFSVVLIGILIAFQLNKCSDNKTQEDLIKNHIKELKLESNENISRLEYGINHSKQQLVKADSLLNYIINQGEVNIIKNLSAELLDLRSVSIKKDAYKVLTESGDVRFINRFNDKRNIILLYEQYTDIKNVDENAQKIYDDYYYPYIKDNFDLVNWNSNNKFLSEEIKNYHSKEFGNLVSTYRYLLNVKIKTYEETIIKTKNYLGIP